MTGIYYSVFLDLGQIFFSSERVFSSGSELKTLRENAFKGT